MKTKEVIISCLSLMTTTILTLGQSAGTRLWDFTASPRIFVDPLTGETQQLPAYTFSSPAVGADQTIYFGSGNGKFYALTPAGTEKWSFQTGAEIQSSPAIGSDGTIYFGSVDGKLYALNPDGTKKWEFPTGWDILSSPAIASDGTIYIGSRDKNVYAVNPDGAQKWSFATGGYVDSSPVIGADGTIYVGSFDWSFYALNPDGSRKWRYTYGVGPGGGSGAGVAIGLDGTLYVTMGVEPRKLYALRPDGSKIWEFTFGSPVAFTYASAPVIGSDGTIYAAANDHKVYAVNPDGTKKWEALIGAYIYSTSAAALGRDGMIYFSGDLSLFAFDSHGVKQWEFVSDQYGAAGGITSIPNLIHPGIIYVGSGNGKLYAVKASAGLAESAWPMSRRDGLQRARATGMVVRTLNSLAATASGSSLNLVANIDPDRSYRLQTSADLQTWATVTNLASASGVSVLSDAIRSDARQRFYRLVTP
ncbi:MAG: PQQ-like beta-propeller repeat protein [Verrucomicrobia bacterium]|nr:MAG: PQQ-like beta-propeller repeat protein [Verrucomicrobiota bacterium]